MTAAVDIAVAVLIVGGAAFALVAAVGVLRMPDLLMRMHAATKAGTLGAVLVLLALLLDLGTLSVATRAIATVVFLALTAPVASHVLARAAARGGQLRLWARTELDERAPREAADDNLAPTASEETA